MFYLLCYFNLPLYFFFVCSFVSLSKGLKFKAHTLYVGTCQPALLFNVTFCWSEPCVPNVYSSVDALNIIITVHKKIWRKILGFFGCIFRKKKTLKVVTVCQICIPKKELTGADRIFCCSLQQKRLNTICTFFWIWVAVLLQRRPALCLSPRTQLTSVRGPPFNPFHCVLPALTLWCLQLLISVSQWKGTGHGAFKTPPKEVHEKICKFSSKAPQYSSLWIPVSFSLFPKWFLWQAREQMFSHSCAGLPIL